MFPQMSLQRREVLTNELTIFAFKVCWLDNWNLDSAPISMASARKSSSSCVLLCSASVPKDATAPQALIRDSKTSDEIPHTMRKNHMHTERLFGFPFRVACCAIVTRHVAFEPVHRVRLVVTNATVSLNSFHRRRNCYASHWCHCPCNCHVNATEQFSSFCKFRKKKSAISALHDVPNL